MGFRTERPRGVWSEEEMREIEPEVSKRTTGARGRVSGLRAEVNARGLMRMRAGVDELTRGGVPSVIFSGECEGQSHGNFIDASYRRILANAAWARRLGKAHTAKRQARATGAEEEVRAWRELDCAASSDALLMNVFCYPRVLESSRLRALLGVEAQDEVEFGVRSLAPLARGLMNTTEIDMRIGDLLVEAKLTEGDFQYAPMRLVERYVDLDDVFEREALDVTRRGVRSYQLIRGVLAAHAAGARFCVLCDGRRPDLVEAWYGVMRAVKSFEMRGRLRLVTWQEVAGCVPKRLAEFLKGKYGIRAS